MAQHRIKNPDGTTTVVVLPDDASPEEIEDAISESAPPDVVAANTASDRAYMDKFLPWMRETTEKKRVKGLGNPVTVPPKPDAPAPLAPQSMLASSPTDKNREAERTYVESTDWNAVGREQVHNIPKYAAAALAAAGLAAAPATGGISAYMAYPALAAMFGYGAGMPVRSAVQAGLDQPITEGTMGEEALNMGAEGLAAATGGMTSVPGAGQAAADFVTRQVPNAAKTVAGWLPGGKLPAQFAGARLREAPSSGVVQTALKERIPLTKGTAISSTKEASKKVWEPAEQLVEAAEGRGATIDRDVMLKPIQKALDHLAKVAPGGENSPAWRNAFEEYTRFMDYPEQIGVKHAEQIKQYINKAVKSWESSFGKDIAQHPTIAVLKAGKAGIPKAIGEATGDPAAYALANQRYGNLSDLLEKRGRFSPAARADIKHAEQGGLKNLYSRGKELALRPRQALNEFVESKVPNPWEVRSQRFAGRPKTTGGIPETELPLEEQAALGAKGPAQAPWADVDIYAQQNAPSRPFPDEAFEGAEGTLMEGQVPAGTFRQPEAPWGEVQPGITSEGLGEGANLPLGVRPWEIENTAGTLMEGELPILSEMFKLPKLKGRKK